MTDAKDDLAERMTRAFYEAARKDETDGRGFDEMPTADRADLIACMATAMNETGIEALTAQVEAAWREGWALCKASLTDDEALGLTDDVETDAWVDSKTRALKTDQPK